MSLCDSCKHCCPMEGCSHSSINQKIGMIVVRCNTFGRRGYPPKPEPVVLVDYLGLTTTRGEFVLEEYYGKLRLRIGWEHYNLDQIPKLITALQQAQAYLERMEQQQEQQDEQS